MKKNPPVLSRVYAVLRHLRTVEKDQHCRERQGQNRHGFNNSRHVCQEELLRGHPL